MKVHTSYIGIKPFGVLIDDSPELQALTERARKISAAPFEDKFRILKKMAIGSMVNAYEQWKTNPDKEKAEAHKKMVFEQHHTLSDALRQRSGCCRYQGALFFALGYEADLGDRHFIQQAPVNPDAITNGMRSVFNDVEHNSRLRHVSIFKDSLLDPALDYSRQNPQVFDSAIGFSLPESNPSPRVDPWKMIHYSYHRTDSGLVIVSESSKHVERYP